ncbi:superfamily I DNA/RNA helicase [Nitzschia inconspicua]|uniref:Superfamily I DNA/RNA helicase n=1 Tax=Nitzschia inconspicua TaxID=303405 RepID=A0A9K3KI36_9STRA|nr:superfamily I DNA/RNA helicase [Nitzschia inconspicua]
MTESESKSKPKSSCAPSPPASTTTSSTVGRGRGRGRGGRGGRGRGRSGGRGRGGRHSSHKDKKDDTVAASPTNAEATTNNHSAEGAPVNVASSSPPSHVGGRCRGRGGRGRSSNGRGRGRSGRGRGGRGNGPNSANDTSRSNSPIPATSQDIDENLPLDIGYHDDESANQNINDEDVGAGWPENAGDQQTTISASQTIPATTPTLSLPPPPRHLGGKTGVPMILSRRENPPLLPANNQITDYDSEMRALSESLAASALEDGEEKEVSSTERKQEIVSSSLSNKPPKEGKKKFKKKKKEKVPETPVEAEEPVPEVSTTEALQNMPAQEVSITATTTVQIRRSESSASFNKDGDDTPIKFDGTSRTTKVTKKGKSKKKKGLSKDDAVNQKAAKHFNKAVRQCVERSDPDGVRELLHDKHNHNFALDKTVLETVMKAYVMAAMFEDGLYCLRNCTLPGTLSTIQTERILTCMPQNLRNSSAYTAADMINALCIATEFDNPTSRTYFLRIVRGISLEFLEEVMSARDRICSAPCERLVRSAVCVVAARLKRGKKPTDLVVHPGDQLGIFVPDSMENRGIQAGDAVSILPYAGPYPMSAESLDRNMLEATVTNTNPMVLRLQDKANASLYSVLTDPEEGNIYRIDKLANRMGFNRQLAAAVAIASPIGDIKTRDFRRPSPQLIKAITAMDENIDRVMNHSSSLLNGELTSTAAICAEAVPWSFEDEDEDGADEYASRTTSQLALEKYNALEGLNESQRLAVEGAVTNRLTLVQGPPGTGKTAVAIRILQHWARLAKANARNGENPSPILATSDSNIAVDNLVEGCAAVGLSVVRLGRPEAIRPELLRFCIDRPPSSYGSGGRDQNGANPAMAFKERMKQLKKAQIVCCTCIGSGGDILDAMTFDRVLVDEATQATEPAVLVPLMRGCRQLVLVGDHCQLPPTVLSTRAEEEGHGVPLFSRMVACGVPPFMLDTQYRMHPCIAMFPSDLFYGGKLNNGVTAPERRPLAGFPWPREEFPVAFVPTKGIELDDGVSKMNEAEAEAACDAVAALLSGGQCTPSDIAVVTPYAAQARLIRRLTRRLLPQNAGQSYIEVSSVDGFQGREKEAVVFSAVRSNDYGAIGFTSDWRRVNVSFTRARRALIVIGNDQTLRRGDPDTWGPWLAWADAHGLNMDKPGVSRGRYDPEQLRKVRGGTTAAEMLKDVLARQQAQLKSARSQLEKAEKNAAGHIIGNEDEDENIDDADDNGPSLEEDLAQITNADGNWDSDDEDDENDLHRSSSQPTLSSAGRTAIEGSSSDSDGPADVWDL